MDYHRDACRVLYKSQIYSTIKYSLIIFYTYIVHLDEN